MGPLKNTPFCSISSLVAQILILKILNVFLWLDFSPALTLSKIEYFSKVSKHIYRRIELYNCRKAGGFCFPSFQRTVVELLVSWLLLSSIFSLFRSKVLKSYRSRPYRHITPESGVSLCSDD